MSPQNTSSAVMQQRSEAHDSLDDFPTAPWATRALFRYVIFPRYQIFAPERHFKSLSCWEPCCNRGYMVRPLQEHFGRVFASDVHDYGWAGQEQVWDFLFPDKAKMAHDYDWFVFNPPFRLAVDFILRAFELFPQGVAVFVRTSFIEGNDRYARLFSKNPPSIIAHFVERVILHKGVCRDPDVKYWDPKKKKWKKPSTATSYTWLTWMDGVEPQAPIWIPPCRLALTKPGDYDDPIVTITGTRNQTGDIPCT